MKCMTAPTLPQMLTKMENFDKKAHEPQAVVS